MKTAHRERGVAIAAILMAALFSVLVAPSAQAAPPTPSRATVASGGIPALVNPTADLAAQVPGPEVTWVDSIFIAGRVHAAGHNFGILVHTLDSPNADQRKLYVSIADTTTGWYRNYAAMIPKDHYMWSRKRLHITMPGLSWTGSERQMHVKATTPWGSLNARFGPKGPVLNYQSNELIELLGDVNYEYAFPAMRTVGTLTAESRKRRVSGVSWLDRQWGPLPLTDAAMRWTWMNITLSNGDQLALWDILGNHAQNSWLTAQRPDSSYEIAAVKPCADGASEFWTSPATGNSYPTRWRIDIPALRSRLSVNRLGPKGQEFPDGHVETTAAVTGTYQRRRVTGNTFVEMTGAWTSSR